MNSGRNNLRPCTCCKDCALSNVTRVKRVKGAAENGFIEKPIRIKPTGEPYPGIIKNKDGKSLTFGIPVQSTKFYTLMGFLFLRNLPTWMEIQSPNIFCAFLL